MQHHLFALFVTTVLIAIWLVDGSIAGSTTSQSCYQEDANCNSEEDEDEFDVFAKLSKLHDDGSKFFMKNIFNKTESSQGKGSLFFKSDNEESTQKQGEGLVGILQSFTKMMLSPQSEHGAAGTNVANFLESARSLASLGDQKEKRGVAQIVDLFKISFDKAYETFERHFGNVKFDKLPISFLYFLEKEDEVKNPSWKRRQHRYYQSIDMKTVYELHNSLYLAQLSYVDSVGSVKEGLDDFEGSLELIYCKTEAFPGEPAHFIAIKKEGKSPGKSLFSWPQQEESVLEVVMVVRGTKEIGDLLTDALMDESNYRGGMTHSGVHQGAEYIFDKHIGLMDHLLEITGRQKLRLNLVGHSLGAGVAAIAAQMFNDRHYIEANAVGFGCPAVFSKELSESTRDFVTTVIVDSDIGKSLVQLKYIVNTLPPSCKSVLLYLTLLVCIFSPSDERGDCCQCSPGHDVLRLDATRTGRYKSSIGSYQRHSEPPVRYSARNDFEFPKLSL